MELRIENTWGCKKHLEKFVVRGNLWLFLNKYKLARGLMGASRLPPSSWVEESGEFKASLGFYSKFQASLGCMKH